MKALMRLSSALVGCLSAASAAQPKWPATWDMKASTLFMPCNYSGFLDPSISAKWGGKLLIVQSVVCFFLLLRHGRC